MCFYIYIFYIYVFIYVNKSYVVPQKCHAIEKEEIPGKTGIKKKKIL